MEHVRVAADVDAPRGLRARGATGRRSDNDTGHLPVGRVDKIRARWADSRYLREQQYASPDNLDARIALHRRFSTNSYGWPRWMFDQIEAPDDARVVDVGCGPALIWVENLNRIPPGWSVTLVDLSPGMIAAARERLGDDVRFALGVADAQLDVTEVDPLMDVVLSGVADDLLDSDELAAIRARMEQTIQHEGTFRITKSSGVFVCR